MQKFFDRILNSWGGDTPSEVFWALNDMVFWAKQKGFNSDKEFKEFEYSNEENIDENNEMLVQELVEFFEHI